VLPLSITNILSFPYGHPIDAYVFSVVLPSRLSSKQWLVLDAVPMQDVTNPVSLPSFYLKQDIPFLLYAK
jgi:hypothetical protein